MAAVGMMQVAGDEVVHMVAVRNGVVATARPVSVALGVTRAVVRRRASSGVFRTDIEDTFVDVIFVGVVKVAFVKVVDVIAMADGGVAAAGAVDVIVTGMGVVAHEFFFPWGVSRTTAGSPACSSAARMSPRTWSSASE
jgi:hypothetical protein